jgi:hypothetical protein
MTFFGYGALKIAGFGIWVLPKMLLLWSFFVIVAASNADVVRMSMASSGSNIARLIKWVNFLEQEKTFLTQSDATCLPLPRKKPLVLAVSLVYLFACKKVLLIEGETIRVYTVVR